MIILTLVVFTVTVIILFLLALDLAIFLGDIVEIDDYREIVILLFLLFLLISIGVVSCFL